jgi:hypothetical protein
LVAVSINLPAAARTGFVAVERSPFWNADELNRGDGWRNNRYRPQWARLSRMAYNYGVGLQISDPLNHFVSNPPNVRI